MAPYLLLGCTSAIIGLAAGWIMHRADFCMAGAFRDLFLFRQTFMLRIILVMCLACMVLFETARLAGLIADGPFPMIGPPALTNLLGGGLFGLGMVLAGGCVVGTLYKLGAGSLLSGLALCGLVAGSAFYGEIHTWWSALARATTLTAGQITLPQLLGVASPGPILLVAAAALFWISRSKALNWRRQALAEGYLQPFKAGLWLAALGTASYLVVGMPLGITTAYAKTGAYLGTLLAPDHFADLAYFKGIALDYRPPFATQSLTGGAGPVLDIIAAIQFPLIGGIVLGSAGSALVLREFHPRLRVPLRQGLSALLGGALMGLAARMAPACNVWHLLGGLPILALQSLLFVAGLLPGAWLGARVLSRVVIR